MPSLRIATLAGVLVLAGCATVPPRPLLCVPVLVEQSPALYCQPLERPVEVSPPAPAPAKVPV